METYKSQIYYRGDIVDSAGIGLVGQHDNPMPEVDYIHSQGLRFWP